MLAKTIASLLDKTSIAHPNRLALISPFQSQFYTYTQLQYKTNALAGFLTTYGYQTNDVLISDLPNISENLILQIACNRAGIRYGTAKNLESMAKFPKVKGAVCASSTGFLSETNLPLPYLGGDYLLDLIENGLEEFSQEDFDEEEEDGVHAYYGSTAGYTNRMALEQGREAAEQLVMNEQDVVCVSITLCHAFGMGSAVCSALDRGASIVLPAVGGIQGCGVPSERAAATFQVLESEKCTLLFADTHTLKALPDDPMKLYLRGGVCKIGSGSTFLEEKRKYGGVSLKTIGKVEV
jgi:acyl-CoA synthetase (AMP-forming)/AMP-acid ligase II